MKFVLPLPVNLANSRIHWATKHKRKLEYWAELDLLMMLKRIPPTPPEPFASVSLAHTWYLYGTPMDEGNSYNRLKWVEDWLVTRGYLVDDKSDNVHLLRPVQYIDRKNQRLELILTVEPTK